MFEDSRRCLAVAVLAAGLGGGAAAAPVPLSEADLDRVTAGEAADLGRLQREVIDGIVLPALLRAPARLADQPEASAALDTIRQLIDDLALPSGVVQLPAVQMLAAGEALTASRSIGGSLGGPFSIAVSPRGRNVPGNIVIESFQTDSAAGTSVSVTFAITGSGPTVIIPGGAVAAGR